MGSTLGHALADGEVLTGTLGVVLLMVAGWLGNPPASTGRERGLAYSLAGVGALCTFGVIAVHLAHSRGWVYILAAVPSFLILQQALFLRLSRRGGLFARGGELRAGVYDGTLSVPSFPKKRRELGADPAQIVQILGTEAQQFSVETLFVRFGLPALLSFLVTVAVGEALFDLRLQDALTPAPSPALRGARFAAAGAYSTTLLYLGQRALKRDLTTGVALWAAVSLLLGPILGASLTFFWKPSPSDSLSEAAFFFLAGMSPRQVAAFIQEAVRRLWMSKETQVESRTIHLSRLRAVGADVEDRLAEEGITDVVALSMADPVRLYRNTNFEKRQILSWIDEAILIVTLPKHWEALEAAGITGAIDLAYYSSANELSGPFPNPPSNLDRLCGAAGLDAKSLFILKDASERLFEDSQVIRIWALYQGDQNRGWEPPTSSEPTQTLIPPSPDGERLRRAGRWAAPVALLAVLAALTWDTLVEVFQLSLLASLVVAGVGVSATWRASQVGDANARRWWSLFAAVCLSIGGATLTQELVAQNSLRTLQPIPMGWLLAGAAALLTLLRQGLVA